MEEIIYITPNGSEVDELTLRNKYGDRFDQLVLDNVLKKKRLVRNNYGFRIGNWHFGFTRA